MYTKINKPNLWEEITSLRLELYMNLRISSTLVTGLSSYF